MDFRTINTRIYQYSKQSFKLNFTSSSFQKCGKWYTKDLKAHTGCVNALDFSHDGSYLASGGDDRRILIWRIGAALSSNAPIPASSSVYRSMDERHNSNIFCMCFTNDDKQIISAGNDACSVIHDVESGKCADVFMVESAIYGLSTDPFNSSIFGVATHHGSTLIYDTRQSGGGPMDLTASSTETMHDIKYNPVTQHFVITMSNEGPMKLWDLRHTLAPVLEYTLPHSRRVSTTKSGGMACCFNSTGDKIFSIWRKENPVLYNMKHENAIQEYTDDGYYNGCTLKSCAFAGPRQEYVVTGSDNFGIYLWKAKTDNEEVFVNDKPHKILHSHRSIVNHVRYNDSYSVLASCGVEKVIKTWSPFHISNTYENDSERCLLDPSVIDSIRPGHAMLNEDDTEEDPIMLSFFDNLIQRDMDGSSSSESASEYLSEIDSDTSERELSTPPHRIPVSVRNNEPILTMSELIMRRKRYKKRMKLRLQRLREYNSKLRDSTSDSEQENERTSKQKAVIILDNGPQTVSNSEETENNRVTDFMKTQSIHNGDPEVQRRLLSLKRTLDQTERTTTSNNSHDINKGASASHTCTCPASLNQRVNAEAATTSTQGNNSSNSQGKNVAFHKRLKKAKRLRIQKPQTDSEDSSG